jgi:hypothetical protein
MKIDYLDIRKNNPKSFEKLLEFFSINYIVFGRSLYFYIVDKKGLALNRGERIELHARRLYDFFDHYKIFVWVRMNLDSGFFKYIIYENGHVWEFPHNFDLDKPPILDENLRSRPYMENMAFKRAFNLLEAI